MATENQPKLAWDWGTAYDLFVSLNVLHEPGKFGLRGSWAAGVRSRIPLDEREILEVSVDLLDMPIHWVFTLPKPKDSAVALWTLGQIPAEDRLLALGINPETPVQIVEVFKSVAERGSWDEKDQEALRSAAHEKEMGETLRSKTLAKFLDWWSRPDEFGERYLAALQSYHQAFFAEEEVRIRPALIESLEHAKELASRTDVNSLVEELSQGIRFTSLSELSELVLAPSYWSTPLVVYNKLETGRMLLVYGARPAVASLVPGEVVPDALLHTLKALADPTRLKILKYLAKKPLTPAQLSRRLRLRAPTVTHHLYTLRLAGLVYLTLEAGGERRYAVRLDTAGATFEHLKQFLEE